MRPFTAGSHSARRDRSRLSERIGGRLASTARQPSPASPPVVIALITPSAVVTTRREEAELRGQGDIDHVRKVRVGPRTLGGSSP